MGILESPRRLRDSRRNEIKLRRVSPARLSCDAALVKEKQ